MEDSVLNYLKDNIPKLLNAKCEIIPQTASIPNSSFNAERRQYHSSIILAYIKELTKNLAYTRVLGVTNVDLYVPHLNFVFGEAELNGKVALISLFRLRQEFYDGKPNKELFLERALKEAVHELGHTFGLNHCRNPLCVMFFSNSIIDTDRKKPSLCKKCLEILELKQ